MPSDISQLAECNRQIRTMKLRRRSIKIRTPHGGETGDTHVPNTTGHLAQRRSVSAPSRITTRRTNSASSAMRNTRNSTKNTTSLHPNSTARTRPKTTNTKNKPKLISSPKKRASDTPLELVVTEDMDISPEKTVQTQSKSVLEPVLEESTEEPEIQEPEIQAPEIQEPGIQEPEILEPEILEPETSVPDQSSPVTAKSKKTQRRRSSGFKITKVVDEESGDETSKVEREEEMLNEPPFYFTPSKKRRRDTMLSDITERTEFSMSLEGLTKDKDSTEGNSRDTVKNASFLSNIQENSQNLENDDMEDEQNMEDENLGEVIDSQKTVNPEFANLPETSPEMQTLNPESMDLPETKISENQPEPDIPRSTTPELAYDVTEFESELAKTNVRLDKISTTWKTILENESENLNENTLGDINAAIGKIGLLQNKKFKQYSNLIKYCKLGQGDPKEGDYSCNAILPKDLRGYWDICGIQIDQVEGTFKDLEERRENNWIEVEVKIVKNVRKIAQKPKKLKSKNAVGGADEARIKKLQAQKEAREAAKVLAKARFLAVKKDLLEKKKRDEEAARVQNESMNIEEMEVEDGGNTSFHIL